MSGRLLRGTVVIIATGLVVTACAKVPYTGRKQLNMIPNSLMRSLGKASYQTMLGGSKVRKKGEENDVLQQVGRRISTVAKEPKFDWDFTLIDDDAANAWCLPGGYIGFYTGILPYLRNEAGMAFVMGHEVGHATAHHGAERLSQQLTLVGGLAGLGIYLDRATELKPEHTAIILGVLGVGAQVGIMLPFSRSHEAEADVIGMMYSSTAGYPPNESIDFWQRMRAAGGGGLPDFLSTHPSHDRRQENLREWMPQARKRYNRNKLAYDTTAPLWSGVDAPSPGRRRGARNGDGAPADSGDDAPAGGSSGGRR